MYSYTRMGFFHYGVHCRLQASTVQVLVLAGNHQPSLLGGEFLLAGGPRELGTSC